MSTRTSSLALLLAVAACGTPKAEPARGDRIDCALDGASVFAHACTLERIGMEVVIHRPDGGFRRFFVAGNQRVEAADGADPAASAQSADGAIEVTIARDRFRVPALAVVR